MTTPSEGQRLSFGGALCTVHYVGKVAGAGVGNWLGVEWDDVRRGKHDGVHKGVRYFSCRRRPPPGTAEGDAGRAWTPASFVRPTRPADQPRSFLAALRAKYLLEEGPAGDDGGGGGHGTGLSAASSTTAPGAAVPATRPVVISGKVAEEVGFEKVQRQLAQLDTLRVVILDEMCIGDADGSAGGADGKDGSIRQTCPSITDLDLSRNLFVHLRTVAAICRELPALRSLRINGDRFAVDADIPADAFSGVHELSADETLLSWAELGALAAHFPALAQFSASGNQLTACVPALAPSATIASTLTTLSLEYNDFTTLADLAGLTGLRALRALHLKGCRIAGVAASTDSEAAAATATATATAKATPSALVFSPTLHHVDLSYNCMASWACVDALAVVFPGLRSLRIAHNPIYDNPHLGLPEGLSAAAATATATPISTTPLTEESFMLTVGRLGLLRSLNFSTVSAADRSNAEMFYLSRIAKQLAAVAPEDEARLVLVHHRRYDELCALYGEPAVVRHAAATNAAFLEARLVRVRFCKERVRGEAGAGAGRANEKAEEEVQTVEIPKSFDMYAVKGLVGRLFGTAPRRLRLVWETGEWDPVVGVDEDEEELEEEDNEIDAEVDNDDEDERAPPENDSQTPGAARTGRWVKREVELKDSPRQFGFCVDGVEARIRVEVR